MTVVKIQVEDEDEIDDIMVAMLCDGGKIDRDGKRWQVHQGYMEGLVFHVEMSEIPRLQ